MKNEIFDADGFITLIASSGEPPRRVHRSNVIVVERAPGVTFAKPHADGTPESFSDRRVFVTIDPEAANTSGSGRGLYWGQSESGPTKAFISREVSDANLAMMADRHGLDLGELRAFRDVADVGATMLATPAEALQ